MADTINGYREINYLGDVRFIGGTEFTITVDVFDENGAEQNLNASTSKLYVSPYGQQSIVLIEKSGTIIDTNTIKFVLSTNDTASLSGIYNWQIVIISFDLTEYRLGQGTLSITQRIK